MATPAPSTGLSAETRAKLQKLGVPIKPWDPAEIMAVMHGHRTLGELAHISKAKQRELAATGVKLLKDGLTEKAKEIFDGLEALDPYDAYVQVVLGTLCLGEEDDEGAEARFTRALELNPVSVPALAYRGELRLRRGQRKEGLADLNAALARDGQGLAEVTARAKALIEAAGSSTPAPAPAAKPSGPAKKAPPAPSAPPKKTR